MFNFQIYNGMPGYLPNSIDAYQVETADEAIAIIKDAIERFCADDYAHQPKDVAGFLDRCKGFPDASMWQWTIAVANEGAEEQSVSGLTDAEYDAFGEE